MSGDAVLVYKPAVSEKREKYKKRAEQAFAFGDPGDALDIEGMQRKECGDECASPEKTGGGAQQEKQEHHVHTMKNQAGGVMSGRMQAEDLHVHHMGNPGKRMRVGHDGGVKSPGNIGCG